MRRKFLLSITITVILTTIAVSTVFAGNPIRLFINGKEVKPMAPIQILSDRVLVPVRQIAEELGATVEWDDINQTVKISNQEQHDVETRLEQLEFALVSQSPEEVANTWAKGIASRNGALQYAVLSDELQAKYKTDYEAWDWRTGASSPWVESYKISNGEKQSDGTYKFTIEYHYTDSTKTDFSRTSSILVGPKKLESATLPVYPGTEQKWCVTAINAD